MKVLLINTPVWKEVGFKSAYNPGMGLLYVGAVLRDKGHEVRIIDAEALGWWHEDILEEIAKWNPTHVGLSSLSNGLMSSTQLCKKIKEEHPSVWVAMGGVGPSSAPSLTLQRSGADSVTVGEAELVLEQSFTKVGIIYGIVPENLDVLPSPAYDLLEPTIGSRCWSGNLPKPNTDGETRETVVMWSRGCPHACTFCSKASMKRGKPRTRNPKKVSEELKMLHDKYNINSVFVYDDELIGMGTEHEKWLFEVLEEITVWNEDGHFNPLVWLKGQGRCSEKFVTEESGLMLKDAGFFAMMMGCESGSDEVKKIIKKGTTNDDIKHTLEVLSKYVSIYGFWMIGMPGETSKHAGETERLIYEVSKYMEWIQITIFSPLPGSDFWDEALENGWLNGNILTREERWIYSIENLSKNFQVDAVLDMPWMSRDEIRKWQNKLYSVYKSVKKNG